MKISVKCSCLRRQPPTFSEKAPRHPTSLQSLEVSRGCSGVFFFLLKKHFFKSTLELRLPPVPLASLEVPALLPLCSSFLSSAVRSHPFSEVIRTFDAKFGCSLVKCNISGNRFTASRLLLPNPPSPRGELPKYLGNCRAFSSSLGMWVQVLPDNNRQKKL